MDIMLEQEIAPFAKVTEKHGVEGCAPIKMRTAWAVDDEMWRENPALAFDQTARALRPAAMFVDGQWKDTEVIAPASRWSLICAVANAFCEYTGLQLFKLNYSLAHPELARKDMPRNAEHEKRLCHMSVKAMFGCYPDEMDEGFLDDLCHFTNWEVRSSEMRAVGSGDAEQA